ncbi:LysE family transporter [Paracoccaceae bacterium Fryx2]|nr:LysE family transporter [Paracoccaceae bacterium Fryx2]
MTLPLAQFVTVWGFLAINIVSPGPNVINTIATAMGSGRQAGIGSAVGVGLGIGGWCLFMSVGMASVFALLPGAQVALTLAAIALLAVFSSRYLRAAWAGFRGGPDRVRGRGGLDFAAGFRRSLLINALNPKALTSWLAILTLFPVARAAPGDIALLCAGACVLSFTIHSGYALLFSTPAAARFYLAAGWAISGVAGLFFAFVALRLLADVLSGTA